jgi:hypothetical protein
MNAQVNEIANSPKTLTDVEEQPLMATTGGRNDQVARRTWHGCRVTTTMRMASDLTKCGADGSHRPAMHPDPRAQQPHGHLPGVTNPDATPWQPINLQAGRRA